MTLEQGHWPLDAGDLGSHYDRYHPEPRQPPPPEPRPSTRTPPDYLDLYFDKKPDGSFRTEGEIQRALAKDRGDPSPMQAFTNLDEARAKLTEYDQHNRHNPNNNRGKNTSISTGDLSKFFPRMLFTLGFETGQTHLHHELTPATKARGELKRYFQQLRTLFHLSYHHTQGDQSILHRIPTTTLPQREAYLEAINCTHSSYVDLPQILLMAADHFTTHFEQNPDKKNPLSRLATLQEDHQEIVDDPTLIPRNWLHHLSHQYAERFSQNPPPNPNHPHHQVFYATDINTHYTKPISLYHQTTVDQISQIGNHLFVVIFGVDQILPKLQRINRNPDPHQRRIEYHRETNRLEKRFIHGHLQAVAAQQLISATNPNVQNNTYKLTRRNFENTAGLYVTILQEYQPWPTSTDSPQDLIFPSIQFHQETIDAHSLAYFFDWIQLFSDGRRTISPKDIKAAAKGGLTQTLKLGY